MSPDPPISVPASDPRLGMVLQDRYRIVRMLGEGGMGVVYEGEHLLIKRRVAIKCLHAQFARDPEVVTRFHREAMAAASIGNEHIVEVTDMGVLDDGAPYMVLEFLEGRDLERLIDEEGPLSLERVVHIACQLCDALTAVHDKGITHRDLKPANLFLVPRGETGDFVKILDFGISKFRSSVDGQATNLTAAGSAIGTLNYMPPEQLSGRPDTDHRADIYALGGIMHYALTGRNVFVAESAPLLVVKVASEPPPPLRSCGARVPPAIEEIVLKALAKEPAERFQSAAELKRALLPHRAAAFATVPPEAEPAKGAAVARVWWAVAAVALLLLGLLLLWRTQGQTMDVEAGAPIAGQDVASAIEPEPEPAAPSPAAPAAITVGEPVAPAAPELGAAAAPDEGATAEPSPAPAAAKKPRKRPVAAKPASTPTGDKASAESAEPTAPTATPPSVAPAAPAGADEEPPAPAEVGIVPGKRPLKRIR